MRRAITAALARVETNGMAVLHVSVNHYRLDDARGVREPENMHGKSLEADINVVLADPNMMANLGHVLERCHLDVAGFVVSSYAASRSALLEDEMELGVALVELGGGTTSYAVFNEGVLAAAGALPVGSHHVTADIAHGLNTPLAHAERVKTLWGSAVPAMLDERELITCPILGETGTDAVNRIPRSMICGVIRPRMEEIFEMLREPLAEVPAMRQGIRRVVRAEAPHHRVRGRRRRRQCRQQHDQCRVAGCRLRRRQHRRPGAVDVKADRLVQLGVASPKVSARVRSRKSAVRRGRVHRRDHRSPEWHPYVLRHRRHGRRHRHRRCAGRCPAPATRAS
jgi:cell division ATPase FtsA